MYAVISAFGTSGPYADRAGIDLVFQGESGMMSISGEPGGEPQKTATTIADFVAGTNAAAAGRRQPWPRAAPLARAPCGDFST